MRIVCAVASAAGTAAVRSKAGSEAVMSVAVCARACERVASADVRRSAQWRSLVAIIAVTKLFFHSTVYNLRLFSDVCRQVSSLS